MWRPVAGTGCLEFLDPAFAVATGAAIFEVVVDRVVVSGDRGAALGRRVRVTPVVSHARARTGNLRVGGYPHDVPSAARAARANANLVHLESCLPKSFGEGPVGSG